jgi:TDG/mug DNA glycosylase family protein
VPTRRRRRARRCPSSSCSRRSATGADKPLPDIGGPGLDVLFCGINPGLESARRGHNFARPGNRFWPALHGAGFTPRLLRPEEDGLLPSFGLGITNVVDRASRGAAELRASELRAGAAQLDDLVRRWEPLVVAVVGLGAYRVGFERPAAGIGLQDEPIGGRPAWVLPNPSGLNAHYQLPDLIRLYGELREWVARLGPPARR